MRTLLTLLMFAALTASAAESPATDRWGRVRFLLGHWEGTVAGQPGKGTVQRIYEIVLGGQFIEEHSTSPNGNHRGFISYDKTRRTFVLRQFHDAGFVNEHALNADKSMAEYLIFDSVSFENFGKEGKARTNYDVISPDEFVEIIELAEPGKNFVEHSRVQFKRKK